MTMDFTPVEPLARALLYEGYLLYPYRASALKNQRPSLIGALYPSPLPPLPQGERGRGEGQHRIAHGETEPWFLQTECLVLGDERSTIEARVRFLHLHTVSCEADEREASVSPCLLGDLAHQSRRERFSFPGDNGCSPHAAVEISAEPLRDNVFRLRVRLENLTLATGDAAVPLASPHVVLGVENGRFLSSTDPPADCRDLAETCRNRGAWPVLVGDAAKQNMMLAAPIILYDYPQVAPESPGNLFDCTEIDELLTLRISP
jgi:hydrogenase maturation protease